MKPMARSISMLLAGVLLASLPTGCFWVTTKHEGEVLRRDVNALNKRVQTKESDLEGKINQLEAVLEEATQVLKRNSADLGADFELLSEQVRTLQGLLTTAKNYTDEVREEVVTLKQTVDNDREVMAKRLESLEQRLAELEEKAKEPPPKPPDQLYDEGKAAFDAGDYSTARKLFKQLVVHHPTHKRADDAQFYRGESYFRDKDYDGAIREFQKAFDKYKTSPIADNALFRAGEAAQRLQRCSEARAYFGLLRQKYPRSTLAKKARAKDRQLKRDAKNRRKCAN